MSSPEFRKWWVGTDTARHPTNKIRADSAMHWAYEGWVRGIEAEREACAKAVERARLHMDGSLGLTHETDFIATRVTDFLAERLRARGDKQ